MATRLPNFLIVGAAKSGTTSIANYLKAHPEIFISRVKEPKYITSHFLKDHYKGPGDHEVEANIVKNYEDYLELFSGSENCHAVGEASADLLYYAEQSIPLIKKILGNNIKIIAILRNPVDRAYSAYMHLVRDLREDLDFMNALRCEEKRKASGWEFIWHYKSVGKYYSQISRFMDEFEDVRVYLYDDLIKDPVSLYRDMCVFLSVDSGFVPDNIGRKYNISGVPRSKLIRRLLRSDNIIKSVAKLVVPSGARKPLNELLFRLNLKKQPIDPKAKAYMVEYFSDDVERLSHLLGRDLSHWLA